MNAFDCLVHPQIGTEAFPSVVLEAMACGKPVIATQLDGAMEQVIAGETGLMVPPEDVPSLAGAMRRLFQDRSLCNRFGAAGRERVCAHFTLQHTAQKYLNLYWRLCSGAAVRSQSRELGSFPGFGTQSEVLTRRARSVQLTRSPSVSLNRACPTADTETIADWMPGC